MAEPPTGPVTFLFTDIKGSTRLWEQHSRGMRADLARHDALLRQAIEGHRGRVFKTLGDAFYAVFATPAEAVEAALAAQRALRAELPQIRVRMAVHTGEAEAREGDYFGPALNRVARLLAAGHGGQVLLSAATAGLLPPELLAQIDLCPLGVHRLRDVTARELIFQLLAPGLPDRFPPLNTLDVAFRRGMRRAAAVAAVVVTVVASLALVAVDQAHRAERQRRRAEAGQQALRRTLYAADMSLADQAWETGNLGVARQLLEDHRPRPGQEDLRGFEWRLLWRLTQGDPCVTLHGHTDWPDVAFSPAGHPRSRSWRLVSGSFDRTVRLWDVAGRPPVVSAQQRGSPLQLRDGVRSMAISPDGKLLALGLGGGTLELWDLRTRRRVAARKAHTQLIRAVPFSPDGRRLVTAGEDGTLKLWSVPACRLIGGWRSPSPKSIGLDAAAFSPTGQIVAIVTDDGVITLWDSAAERVQTRFQGFPSGWWDLAFSPDGASLAMGSGAGGLRVWDLGAPGARPRLVADVAAHTGAIFGLAFSPDGKRLASGSADNLVKLWAFAPAHARRAAERAGAALPTLQLRETLRGHTSAVGDVVFSPDGRLLATGSFDTAIRLWDVGLERETEVLQGPRPWLNAVAVWPGYPFAKRADGQPRLLAAGGGNGSVRLWRLDGQDGRPIRAWTFRAHQEGIGAVALSPNGRTLATASDDRTVKLWSLGAGGDGAPREIGTLRGHRDSVNAVAFSPEGDLLATGSDDRTVRLWSPAHSDAGGAWRPVAELRGHTEGVISVAFSPDGRALASGSGDGSVRVWRLVNQGGVPALHGVSVYQGHDRGVRCVAFSPDGRLVAAGGWSSTIRLWPLSSSSVPGREPEPILLRGHQWIVRGLAFSPDGKTLASASEDFTVRLWNLTTRRSVAALKGHTQLVSGLAFSADGNELVSGSADGTVRLWRAATFADTDTGTRGPTNGRPPR